LILSVPGFRKRFFTYGARGDTTDNPAEKSFTAQDDSTALVIERFLDHLATYSVPHSWFLHFYAFSVSLSIFWAYQITTQGYFFVTMAQWTHPENSLMTSQKTIILWWCLFAQGCRRLVECVQGPKSASRMWIVHWFIGVAYYAATNIAIWIEGSSELTRFRKTASEMLTP
jgi:3-oxo-5-alpha-steroid 4-dehydrogenase 3 / polyprenol reductase